MSFIKETWKEAKVLSKKVLTIKDVFGAIQSVCLVVLFLYHLSTNKTLERTEKHRDRLIKDSARLSQKVDSCKVRIINFKYGN